MMIDVTTMKAPKHVAMTVLRAIGFVLEAATVVGAPLSIDESALLVEVEEGESIKARVVVTGVSRPVVVLI